jgi:hypothetical protein
MSDPLLRTRRIFLVFCFEGEISRRVVHEGAERTHHILCGDYRSNAEYPMSFVSPAVPRRGAFPGLLSVFLFKNQMYGYPSPIICAGWQGKVAGFISPSELTVCFFSL